MAIRGRVSDVFQVRNSIAQGTVLGPIFFFFIYK